MQKQQLICVYLSLIVLVSAKMVVSQVVRGGLCPSDIQTVQDFDAEAYLGKWYEFSKYPFIFEAGGRCIQAEYGALTNDSVTVQNTQISILAVIASLALAGDADYWVLGTDYKNYAVVYSCSNLLIAHSVVVWILTREAKPSEDIIKEAENILTSQKISLKPLKLTSQTGCPAT
nr:apolipoprotein D-like [Bactrocera oleae]